MKCTFLWPTKSLFYLIIFNFATTFKENTVCLRRLVHLYIVSILLKSDITSWVCSNRSIINLSLIFFLSSINQISPNLTYSIPKTWKPTAKQCINDNNSPFSSYAKQVLIVQNKFFIMCAGTRQRCIWIKNNSKRRFRLKRHVMVFLSIVSILYRKRKDFL